MGKQEQDQLDQNLIKYYEDRFDEDVGTDAFLDKIANSLANADDEEISRIEEGLGINILDRIINDPKPLRRQEKKIAPSPTYPAPKPIEGDVPMPMIKDRPYLDRG